MRSSLSLSGWRQAAVIVLTLAVALAGCKQTPPTPEPVGPVATAGQLSPTADTLRANTVTPASTPVQETATPEMVTITFAADEYSLPVYEALAEAFNAAHPTVRVIVQNLYEMEGQWLHTFAATPEQLYELASSVDTFVLPETSLPAGLASHTLLDLTPLAESDPDFAPDDFFPGLLPHFQRQGKLWGLPRSVESVLIFYSKSKFDRAGVAYPKPGWTWDDFLDTAVRLTSGEGDEKQYGFFDAWGGMSVIPFIQQHGGDLLDRAAPYPVPTLDDPLVVEAVEWYMALTKKHGVAPERDIWPSLYPDTEKTCAMWTSILHNWWGKSKGPKPVKVGIAPYPEDRTAANPVTVVGYFVSAGTAHPQACWQWILFLTGQSVTSEFAERMPVRRSVFEASDFFAQMEDGDRAALLYILEHPGPPETAYSFIAMSALHESLILVWEGQATVEEALAQAQAWAEERIAQAVAQADAAPTLPPVPPVPSPTPEVAPVRLAFAIGDVLVAAPYRSLAGSFHRLHPQVSVKIESGPSLDFGQAAGSADCFIWPTFSRHGDWQQHVLRLQPFIEATPDFPRDDFYPQGLADLGGDTDPWGLPLLVMPNLIYFNQDLFDAASVPHPAPGWQWDDFSSAAQALTGGDDAGPYGFVPSAAAASEALAFLLQHGASVVDDPDAPMTPAFNTQAAVEALSWYADLAQTHQAMPLLWAENDLYTVASEHASLIYSGQAAMWTGTPWAGDRGYGFAVGAAPLPGDRQQATDFDVWAAYISTYSPHPDQCWNWLVYLSDHLTDGPGIPARRSLAEGPDVTPEGDKAASLASMNHQDTRLNRWRDRTCWLGWVYPWFQQAVQDVLLGRESAAQALDKVQTRAEAFLHCLASPGEAINEAEASACAVGVDPDYALPPSGNP